MVSFYDEHAPDEVLLRERVRQQLFLDTPEPVKVGRYVILERIGSGGLGVVYAAYDPELERKVAIKILKVSPKAQPQRQRRLMREAQVLAKLAHPHVVSVHDVGSFGEGTFVTMQLVDGVTLEEWLANEPRGWQQVRDVLVKAGRGLLAAHDAGVIHRDLKPSNVLITSDGQPKVVDFGLARLQGARATLSGQAEQHESNLSPPIPLVAASDCLTPPETFIGTPFYMAPEQFLSGDVDTRADQFSFCVTLFEAIYGVRPFSGTSVDALREAIESGCMTAVPDAKRVPAWLRGALARGLQARPDARYPSMRELLHVLERDRRSRRRQWSVLAGAVALSGATAATVAWLIKPEPAPEQRSRVEVLTIAAREAAAQGYFVYPPSDGPDRPTAFAHVIDLEQQDGAVEQLAKDAARGLRDEFASTLVRLGDSYWSRPGGRAFSAEYYAQALVFDPNNVRAHERAVLTPTQLELLRVKAHEREFEPAELVAADAVGALATSDEHQQTERLAAVHRRAHELPITTSVSLERLLGDRAGELMPIDRPGRTSQSAFESTVPTINKTAPIESHDVRSSSEGGSGRSLVTQARAAYRAGRWQEAEALFHRALAHDRNDANALSGLSDLHFERGVYHKAADFAHRAVRIAPRTAKYHVQLGDAYFKILQYPEAQAAFKMAEALGDPAATERLERLSQRLGEP